MSPPAAQNGDSAEASRANFRFLSRVGRANGLPLRGGARGAPDGRERAAHGREASQDCAGGGAVVARELELGRRDRRAELLEDLHGGYDDVPTRRGGPPLHRAAPGHWSTISTRSITRNRISRAAARWTAHSIGNSITVAVSPSTSTSAITKLLFPVVTSQCMSSSCRRGSSRTCRASAPRSEERRVGKECRSRWS